MSTHGYWPFPTQYGEPQTNPSGQYIYQCSAVSDTRNGCQEKVTHRSVVLTPHTRDRKFYARWPITITAQHSTVVALATPRGAFSERDRICNDCCRNKLISHVAESWGLSERSLRLIGRASCANATSASDYYMVCKWLLGLLHTFGMNTFSQFMLDIVGGIQALIDQRTATTSTPCIW